MRKSLLTMILALSFISPLFAAEKGDMEIVGKLGVAVNTTDVYVYEEYGDEVYNYEKNPALSIAVEGLYYLLPELPIGLGINYQFNSEKSKPVINSITSSSYESGSTNIYLTVKPTAKIDSKIFTALYAIGQIGFGLNRLDYSGWYLDDGDKIYYEEEVDSNGLYWGLGAGMEIMNNFVFEFVFSTNNWTSKWKEPGDSSTRDRQSTAFTLFAGYRFNL